MFLHQFFVCPPPSVLFPVSSCLLSSVILHFCYRIKSTNHLDDIIQSERASSHLALLGLDRRVAVTMTRLEEQLCCVELELFSRIVFVSQPTDDIVLMAQALEKIFLQKVAQMPQEEVALLPPAPKGKNKSKQPAPATTATTGTTGTTPVIVLAATGTTGISGTTIQLK